MYADLHIHTTYSEGTDDPKKILWLAANHGVKTIAIADHDSVEGVREARRHVKDYDVKLINAVELTSTYQGKEIHILGYHINIDSQSLKEYFTKATTAKSVSTRLNFTNAVNQGAIKYDWDRVVELNPNKKSVTGINVVYAMNHDNYRAPNYSNNWAFFRDYFVSGGKKHIVTEQRTPHDAIHAIKKSGGVPVLAHPGAVGNDNIIKRFLTYGVLGIEVYHGWHSINDNDRYLKMAREHNLFITGGTGWYGKDSPKNVVEFGEHGLKHGAYGILRIENKKIV